MRRLVAASLLVVAALLAPSAAGKAPPNGVDVCGIGNACAHLTTQQIETEWSLFSAVDSGVAPAPVGRFYVVRWSWGDRGAPTNTGYYVPGAGMTRQLDDRGAAIWQPLQHPRPIRQLASTVTPFPAPVFTRVTVGGRAVRDPRSYTKLFGRGVDAFPIILPAWIRIRFTAPSPNPWSDPGADIRISRRGALLWEDGWIVKIPRRLAQQVRAAKPLR